MHWLQDTPCREGFMHALYIYMSIQCTIQRLCSRTYLDCDVNLNSRPDDDHVVSSRNRVLFVGLVRLEAWERD